MKSATVVLAVIFLLTFAACKTDVPNPGPKVALISPTPEKPAKNKVSKPIPLKFSVNDKDGLSDVSVQVVHKNGDTSVTAPIPVPDIASGYVVVDTSFIIGSIPYGKDSSFFWVVINAVDAAGNTFTHRSNFKVYN